ncbi:sugar ABC transporter ATP-binding protein [Streptomyces aureus]|uniref:Sugar ABC transporter ATP-binding protein n=1 Tax=Streptomyces aureus TaxID=193461 RepID=A0ABV4T042_9ACTN
MVSEVDLSIPAGAVHSLVGANGAGKSTLLGMMSGRTPTTHGRILINGHELRSGRPADARRAGLTAVYQELTVLPAMSALDNVFLGQEQLSKGLLDRASMRRRFAELRDDLELDIDPDDRGGDLSVATAQMLEIMRAVQADAQIILFDEPTAALSQRERDHFLELVRRLRARGITMVLVTHNLNEVLRVSDDITVMTAGRKTAEGSASTWSHARLVEAMTGEAPAERAARRGKNFGPALLDVEGVTLPGAVHDVSFSVRAGEVVGLAGLVGSGRTSLLRSLAGAEPRSSGTIRLRGKPQCWPQTVRSAMASGMGLVPEDRKTQGLHLSMSLPDNVTMTRLKELTRFGSIDRSRQLRITEEHLHRLALSREVGSYPVGWLSGGNQQKVSVAKWLHEDPDVLMFDEPTRGIDVGAKADLLDAIRDTADRGKAVIMTSSELDEVLQISDRVVVMSEGAAVAEVDLHAESPTVNDILNLAFRVEDAAA